MGRSSRTKGASRSGSGAGPASKAGWRPPTSFRTSPGEAGTWAGVGPGAAASTWGEGVSAEARGVPARPGPRGLQLFPLPSAASSAGAAAGSARPTLCGTGAEPARPAAQEAVCVPAAPRGSAHQLCRAAPPGGALRLCPQGCLAVILAMNYSLFLCSHLFLMNNSIIIPKKAVTMSRLCSPVKAKPRRPGSERTRSPRGSEAAGGAWLGAVVSSLRSARIRAHTWARK